KGLIDPQRAYAALKPLHTTFKEQFFTERLYHRVLAGGYMLYSRVLYTVAERQFIDGVVNATYPAVRNLGEVFKLVQPGRINLYALFLSVGLFILLILTLLWR
ncbi:MAG: NADH-quinone oxidoreductase subunit L, partial [Acidobacteria bacterium]